MGEKLHKLNLFTRTWGKKNSCTTTMAARRMSRLFAVLLVAGVALENLLPVASGETLADFSIDDETGGGRMMIPRDSRSKRSGETK